MARDPEKKGSYQKLSCQMTTGLQSQSNDFAETKRKVCRELFGQESMFTRCLQLQVFPQAQDTYFLISTMSMGVDKRKTKMAAGIIFLVLRNQLRSQNTYKETATAPPQKGTQKETLGTWVVTAAAL